MTPQLKHRCKINSPLHKWLSPYRSTVALKLAVAAKVQSEGLDVVVETQLAHGPEDILGSDGLALLTLAPVVGLPRDEADELGHALLDCFLGIVGYFGVRREDFAHDSDHVGNWHEPVLLSHGALVVVIGG